MFFFVCLSYMHSQLKQWQRTCRCAGWLAGRVNGRLRRSPGAWLARLSETRRMWFTLRACCSRPQPTVCISPHCLWQLVVPAPEGGGAEPTSDFAFQRLSSGSGAHLAPWEVGALRVIAEFQVPPGHTPTCTRTAHLLLCSDRQRVQSSSRHAGALLHKQTNTPAAPDNRQEEGRGAKQTV